MNENGFTKLFWGFIFIMISFRIQGVDILPDIVGYLLFASAFKNLELSSTCFNTASKYNIPMIILSIFSIYQSPVQGQGVQLGSLGLFTIPIAIASFILNLLIIYNLFMGIKEMAEKRQESDLASDADRQWNSYKMLQIASLCSFIVIFIPVLGLIYIIAIFIAYIIVAVGILGFLKRCAKTLN